ncbi:prophage tail fiber N-terminal domain-containing protein [Serratia ureilytica]|uniref:prophage tail fiber N-terminal domain-containing protein n=1 Tax=Serratia ureilytica TaxID=300181 RepID=UPI00214E930C|nr:prophage tail fiber N-terminal domain-containing protein [Serratia ureilytica]UUW16926.1 prophage tail fiber N-terminal domain-containing protein [Serratia ureilytica]
MVLISGVLKGPYGDARSGVTITMRSLKNSSTVLNLAKSQSVTNDNGLYSLNVEPGAYEVIVSVYGSQPERVGAIEVYTDSLPGTLNDFLRRPGESDITPEIVKTVDRLRAEAALSADKSAASAAAAKISENNAAATLVSAVKNGGYGQIAPPRINGGIGSRQYCKIAESPITATGATGVHFIIAGGRNYGSPGIDIKYVFFSARGATTTALHARGIEVLSMGVTPAAFDLEFGALYNSAIARWELWVSGPAFNVPSITLIGSVDGQVMSGVVPMSEYKWQTAQPAGYKAYAIKNTYSDYNVTVDGNGFLKAASPIARLSGAPESMADDYLDGFTLSGCVAVNTEAEGVSAERVSVGVYKVTGALGFAEEGWNIEVPQDVNGNRLCFVETATDNDGVITVKISKRRFDIDTATVVAGEAMDIPEGRWIDLRLAMPVREEVEVLPPEALVLNDDTPSETNAVS